VALENGLHDLGPAPRVERLCVVDAAAAQPQRPEEDKIRLLSIYLQKNTYGKFGAVFRY
jgi:hypothetical protein